MGLLSVSYTMCDIPAHSTACDKDVGMRIRSLHGDEC